MDLAGVEDLLQASMGLSAMSIGSPAVARAVQERLAVSGLGDLDTYLKHLRLSSSELQALVEAVVVPETWFFRDRHSFTSLARMVHDQWLPAHPAGVLSVLSLPCSTGEEPYSIAMALLDADVAGSRFRVDAVDISGRNISQGIRAVYGRNSFRGADLEFRARHFALTPGGYHLAEAVRRQVHFQQGNLLAVDFRPGGDIYDVIFCRNVLIYFDRPTQDRAIGVLHRLLRADGVLFVAPAETALPGSHGMASTNEPMAFAFQKAGIRPRALRRTVRPVERRAPSPAVVPRGNAGRSAQAAAKPPSALPFADRRAAPAPAESAGGLDEAKRLADAGHFVEAAQCCERHLRESGPSAIAFDLMGLIREATGNYQEAGSYYRKAIYLDPNRYETQIQLALLMEKQGDTGGAQVLRARARRLEQKRKASNE